MPELEPKPERVIEFYNEAVASNASRVKPGAWTSFKNIIKSLEKGGINRPDDIRNQAWARIDSADKLSRQYAKEHGKELAELALKDAQADGMEINIPESGTFDIATKVKKAPADSGESKR